LKEEALDRTMWRNCFGGGFGPVVRQNTEWMKELTTMHGQNHFKNKISLFSGWKYDFVCRTWS